MNRIDEIKARCETVTLGPWNADNGYEIHEKTMRKDENGTLHGERPNGIAEIYPLNRQANAAFIAHSREDIPYLLDEVERLAAELLQKTQELAQYHKAEEEGRLVRLPETGVGDSSDGYHTFNELYMHRAILFGVICHCFPDRAWKSKLHDDGTMYDGMFIVGFKTRLGQATYHYDINPHWKDFKVKELDRAPKWDGHTPDEAIVRLFNFGLDARADAALKGDAE